MTPATATQNLNAKLRRADSKDLGTGRGIDLRRAPIRSYSPPVSIVRRPGYRGGGYHINV